MLAQRAINGNQYPKRTTSLRVRQSKRLQVPDELIIIILSHLKLKDLLNCCQVSFLPSTLVLVFAPHLKNLCHDHPKKPLGLPT